MRPFNRNRARLGQKVVGADDGEKLVLVYWQ